MGGEKITFETITNYPISSNKSKKQKIGIFIRGKTNYYSSNSYIRLLSPLNELTNDNDICIIDNTTHNKLLKDLENKKNLDTIIIQRDIFDISKINSKFIKALFKLLKKNNIRIIFDIDDDLLNIDKTHASYDRYSKIYEILIFILKNSDIITVSTEHLKNSLKEYNENIIIIPNTLMKLWNFNPKTTPRNLNSKKTIKIGYFGTRTHEQDIKIINDAFINLKKKIKNKNIILEIVGVCDEEHEWITHINIPNNYKKNPNIKEKIKNLIQYFFNKFNIMPNQLPYVSFIKWMQNEIDWDIAIAPLEESNINKSKSNLKYLEYTALNIPCIYSNVGPYKEMKIKNTGLIVNNTTEEWENALISLITNTKLYNQLLRNAYNDIEKNYLVENAVLSWKKILNE